MQLTRYNLNLFQPIKAENLALVGSNRKIPREAFLGPFWDITFSRLLVKIEQFLSRSGLRIDTCKMWGWGKGQGLWSVLGQRRVFLSGLYQAIIKVLCIKPVNRNNYIMCLIHHKIFSNHNNTLIPLISENYEFYIKCLPKCISKKLLFLATQSDNMV